MKYITEPKRKLKIYGKYAVVVCGGWLPGIVCAINSYL